MVMLGTPKSNVLRCYYTLFGKDFDNIGTDISYLSYSAKASNRRIS